MIVNFSHYHSIIYFSSKKSPLNIKPTTSISIAFIAIIILNIIVNFISPIAILLSPIVIIALSCIIGIVTDGLSPILKSIAIVSIACFNDIMFKLFSSGNHDFQGSDWITLMFLVGISISYIVIITVALNTSTSSFRNRLAAIIYNPIAVSVHISLFGNFG